MSTESNGFPVAFEFESVLSTISKQIYETPLAFLRENVQNAVDALRMQANRQGTGADSEQLCVRVSLQGPVCEIVDNGIGMTREQLQNLFWTIGASGKRTPEARAAGCVGMFGIGGFANFGVCDDLTVISQAEGSDRGFKTELGQAAIDATPKGTIPIVQIEPCGEAAPRGTIVRGQLKAPPNAEDLQAYITDFVKYASEHVYFDDTLVSRRPFSVPVSAESDRKALDGGTQSWTHGNIVVSGCLYRSPGGVLTADIEGLQVSGDSARATGWVRFEHGSIDALKRGFKLCSTVVATQIGVSGAVDCDRLAPTAGRDSLNADSQSMLAKIVAALERAAVVSILQSTELIGHHTRIFRYVRRNGFVPQLGNVKVDLADGSELLLSDVRRRYEGGIRVFHATTRKPALNRALQAAGHLVVQLPADGNKQIAVREFLESQCGAQRFEGQIECLEEYKDLSRFEMALLAELEEVILASYDLPSAGIVPGRLTEDVPVYVRSEAGKRLTVFVNTRHAEVTKLEGLGITPLFRSMVVVFCREYLAPTLRSHSPKFFGSGAVNLDWLAKKRSELWVLLSKDIDVQRRAAQKQVVRRSDVQVVRAGTSDVSVTQADQQQRRPKLIKIEGSDEFSALSGYYIRIPSRASDAYGDVIQQCDSRGAVWAGNKILLVASDEISSAFQVDIHLDQLITSGPSGARSHGGSSQEDRPLQSMYEGLYFPIAAELEAYLVPSGDGEVRLEIDCEWIDFTSARVWQPTSAE